MFFVPRERPLQGDIDRIQTPPIMNRSTADLLESIAPSLVRIWSVQSQYLRWNANEINTAENDSDKTNRLGRWIAIEPWKVLTAGHLFESWTTTYVIQTYDTVVTPIQNIRKYANDLAVVAVTYNWMPTSYHEFPLISLQTGTKVISLVNGKLLKGEITGQSGSTITTSLKLTPGMSGSPLFTNEWTFIGINTAISNQWVTESYAQLATIPFSVSALTWVVWTANSR